MLMLNGHSDFAGLIGFNKMTYKPVLLRPAPSIIRSTETGEFKPRGITDNDITDIITSFQTRDDKDRVSFRRDDIGAAINRVATLHPFHPVQAYLNGLSFTGTLTDAIETAETWLIRYFGAEDTPITRTFSKRWLIGAVARAFEPGCQMDNVLMLDSAQGIDKSSMLRILGGEWFTDNLPAVNDAEDRRLSFKLRGVWIAELKERAPLLKMNDANRKAFLDRRVETPQAFYKEDVLNEPRQCVFVGTENSRDYLTDPTGNRRYWPVSVGIGPSDRRGFERDRDMILGAAVMLYQLHTEHMKENFGANGSPFQWWLTKEEDELARIVQGEYMRENPYTARIAKFLGERRKDVPLTTSEIGEHALGMLPGSVRGRLAGEIGEAMRELGYRSKKTNKWTVWEPIGGESGEPVASNVVPIRHPETRRNPDVLKGSGESGE
ncbi:hypothetical protein BWR60_07540 [Inquilinus limosus]|uniref:Virulence-associated protein E-like domain-containing protein n=1 Tax=Inquilinus limosus TaxID=171674 RepID=A0A211ZRD0_9PROT|nr:hypothetical protein BWR60_07540 [Inquilinus limosus]